MKVNNYAVWQPIYHFTTKPEKVHLFDDVGTSFKHRSSQPLKQAV